MVKREKNTSDEHSVIFTFPSSPASVPTSVPGPDGAGGGDGDGLECYGEVGRVERRSRIRRIRRERMG